MAARIRFVFFDLGGTLVDECDYLGWADLAARLSIPVDPDDLAHHFRDVEREDDAAGRPSGDAAFWREVLARAGGRPVTPTQAERFVAEWQRLRSPPRLFSDVVRCLDDLEEDGRTLGVVTNSQSEPAVRRTLDQVGLIDRFATVTSSGTEGIAKPDPRLFARALERAGASPAASFHVGHLEYTDARAARAAGIPSVWLHRDGTGFSLDPPEVTSLLEVPPWIRRLEGTPERYPARRR
ncbi:MAG: HAD family hydrolase [Thermoplasmata archaeon]